MACVLVLIIGVSSAAIVSAIPRNSLTFDEIVLIAGGARGWQTGEFDLAPDHPPLLQMVYGLPVHLAGPDVPPIRAGGPASVGSLAHRYRYAQSFLFESGNPLEVLTWRARMPAVVLAGLLVFSLFRLVEKRHGAVAGLVAAGTVAFLPDVLAHGGVAYSDLPVALGYLWGLYMADRTVREPSLANGLVLGLVAGLAVCIKASALALAPAGGLLLALEAIRRKAQRDWWLGIGKSLLLALAVFYVVLALVYQGDWLLEGFRYGLDYRARHFLGGHGAAAFLLGQTSVDGWWYFFPLVFLYKTPAGLHGLMVLALIAVWSAPRTPLHALLSSPLRVPVVGLIVFGVFLVGASLNIGFRYALPALPLLAIVVAVAASTLWRRGRAWQWAVLVLPCWAALHALSYWPHHLAYLSEYGPDRSRNYEVVVDSSLDWGQGLVALQSFMTDQDIDCVALGYFGSARPGAYGIRYVPRESFLPLAVDDPARCSDPTWTVVSASLFQGAYLAGDPYRMLRNRPPDAVIAHTLLAWRD